MYRSIMVPLDGSGFGEYALPYVLGLARRAGAHVHMVHVHAPPVATPADTDSFICVAHLPDIESRNASQVASCTVGHELIRSWP
ncbi:MAG TPA: universal stress protein [Roseiflexaceae bacterium]|nr:universal stress protein [Roseiflexaceae bacterium]